MLSLLPAATMIDTAAPSLTASLLFVIVIGAVFNQITNITGNSQLCTGNTVGDG
jgi:hypothetical protein